jgi:predicted nuclease of predicted toxin-antitoxin system
MNILFDHCVPKRLRRSLSHPVKTTREMGWERLRNGILLAEAAKQFDLLLTVDQNIKHQQNMAMLPVAVVVIIGPSNKLADLLPLVPAIEDAIKNLVPCTLVEVKF